MRAVVWLACLASLGRGQDGDGTPIDCEAPVDWYPDVYGLSAAAGSELEAAADALAGVEMLEGSMEPPCFDLSTGTLHDAGFRHACFAHGTPVVGFEGVPSAFIKKTAEGWTTLLRGEAARERLRGYRVVLAVLPDEKTSQEFWAERVGKLPAFLTLYTCHVHLVELWYKGDIAHAAVEGDGSQPETPGEGPPDTTVTPKTTAVTDPSWYTMLTTCYYGYSDFLGDSERTVLGSYVSMYKQSEEFFAQFGVDGDMDACELFAWAHAARRSPYWSATPDAQLLLVLNAINLRHGLPQIELAE